MTYSKSLYFFIIVRRSASFLFLNDHSALHLTLNPNLLWHGHAALRFTPTTADIPAPAP